MSSSVVPPASPAWVERIKKIDAPQMADVPMPKDAQGRFQGRILEPEELLDDARYRSLFFRDEAQAGAKDYNDEVWKALKKTHGAVVEREYKPGDTVCHEGDFGVTAFYIVSGTVKVFLEQAFQSRTQAFTLPPGGLKALAEQAYIPIDAPINLSRELPVADMKENELFGEATCRNFQPRSATVVAQTDCIMLEMLRNVLDILLANKEFRAQLDEKYRKTALQDYLRSTPLFTGIAADSEADKRFLRQWAEGLEFKTFKPGVVVFQQGAQADDAQTGGMYIVRQGTVKVSQMHAGGELVLAYLGRGEVFGEISVLRGGFRSATCTALQRVSEEGKKDQDAVKAFVKAYGREPATQEEIAQVTNQEIPLEVICIKPADVRDFIDRFPEVRTRLEGMAMQRQQAQVERLDRLASSAVSEFLNQGLQEARSLLVLDLKKCTRCDACVQACADTHHGTTRLIREGLRFENYLVATSCRQCRDPLCMIGCPVGSIQRRQDSLEIEIKPWCIGCSRCAQGCPYGNINMQEFETLSQRVAAGGAITETEAGTAQKAEVKPLAVTCDLCHDLGEASCVYACPHDAAHRMDGRKLFAELQKKGHAASAGGISSIIPGPITRAFGRPS